MVFDEYQVFHLVGVPLKIPLFFWMRYAESQPNLFLNHLETALVGFFCESNFRDNQTEEYIVLIGIKMIILPDTNSSAF